MHLKQHSRLKKFGQLETLARSSPERRIERNKFIYLVGEKYAKRARAFERRKACKQIEGWNVLWRSRPCCENILHYRVSVSFHIDMDVKMTYCWTVALDVRNHPLGNQAKYCWFGKIPTPSRKIQ